ncbi:hypothetical protein BH10BAC5_BH10BAC5_18630 [soil metagenome]
MIRESLSNKYLQIGLRVLIGIVFIFSSLSKLLSQEDFAKAIYNYRMLPDGFVNLAAIILPALEFICGICLIAGIWTKGSSFWVIVMLLVFQAGLISAYARGLDIHCGCFSLETSGSKSDILARIVEDVFLLIGSFIIFLFCNKKEIKDVSDQEDTKADIRDQNSTPDSQDVQDNLKDNLQDNLKDNTLYSDPSHTQFSTKD